MIVLAIAACAFLAGLCCGLLALAMTIDPSVRADCGKNTTSESAGGVGEG